MNLLETLHCWLSTKYAYKQGIIAAREEDFALSADYLLKALGGNEGAAANLGVASIINNQWWEKHQSNSLIQEIQEKIKKRMEKSSTHINDQSDDFENAELVHYRLCLKESKLSVNQWTQIAKAVTNISPQLTDAARLAPKLTKSPIITGYKSNSICHTCWGLHDMHDFVRGNGCPVCGHNFFTAFYTGVQVMLGPRYSFVTLPVLGINVNLISQDILSEIHSTFIKDERGDESCLTGNLAL